MDIKRLISKGLRVLLHPPAITNSQINCCSKICSGTQINNSTIEKYTYIGNDCFCLNAKIGPFCSIADSCRIGGSNHPIERVSTSPVFYSGNSVLKKHFATFAPSPVRTVCVNADVWIGAQALILGGVSIGVGAVIGAGSVVTKDIPPYEIWGGNPACKIKDRFDEGIKAKLLQSKWWTWDDRELRSAAGSFNDPKKFLILLSKKAHEE